MESNSLSSFLIILRESLLLFLRNKSLMASIVLLFLLLHSLLFTSEFFSMKFLLKDFAMDKTRLYLTSPGSSQHTNMAAAVTEDFHLIIGLAWFFILFRSMVSLFSYATTILASAVTYAEVNSSFTDLAPTLLRSCCPRLLVTWFYVSLFDIGYRFLTVLSIFSFTLNLASIFHPTTFLHVILLLIASAFYIYLAVVWNMSIVVSALEEEKSGIESFGKSSQILKGFKLQGFLLNLVFGVPDWIVSIYWLIAIKRKGAYASLFSDLTYLNITCGIKMSLMVAYTVFYHKCKQSHGEEVELQGSFAYMKVSNDPMIITT